ncbi:diguanylate cyclase domain-containing protein [Nisaea nitritireducens]|uniref:diguanylate cyclase domain-containing protein n=1 Tax=Nisaea nitritireducens TaxID=568392 RepID=UPI0018675EC4|nr:diguanylate cyclase [Nisaea nitritireducens]
MEKIDVDSASNIALTETILTSIDQAMLLFDAQHEVRAANSHFRNLFGPLLNGSPVGQPIRVILDAIDGPGGGNTGWSASVTRAAANGDAVECQRIAAGDIVCEMRGLALQQTGYLLTFKDISEQARSEDVLVDEERYIHQILDDSPIGVNIVGPDGRRRYCNRKMHEMLGLSDSEFQNTHAGEHYAEPALRERIIERMRETGAVENEEAELVRSDGGHFWALVSCRPFSYHGEECVLGWVYEITDRMELERSQIRSREELEMQVLELRDREERMARQTAELETLATRLAESERKMAELANHDSLTGLPTLRLCHDRLQQAMAQAQRSQTLMAVFYVDLDGFKPVNDTYGHDAGDQVLKEAANRMRGCFREVDTVSRIGGDEFLVLLTGLGFRDVVVPLAERLLNSFSDEFSFEEGGTNIGASVGIAFFNGASDTSETLIKRADKAMYDAKKNGKNRYALA